MIFREATIKDIPQLHQIRMSVKENVLNNPSLVKKEDYINFLTTNGKGWLCEMENTIVGFAIIDTVENNIWALFVNPDLEGKGIGKQLQQIMLNWFFALHKNTLWLSTAKGTRAETFYKFTGWKETGITKSGEVKFEMSFEEWNNSKH